MSELRHGSIVQVRPEHSGGRAGQWFQNCLVIVTEVHEWGVQGYVQNAGQEGLAYIRLKHGTFVPTGGEALWIAV